MNNQRMKWDAEAAFKRIERHAENKPKFVECGRTFGKSDRPYTPPPNVAAWLKAQADKPKPHGRDYEALRRAAFEPGSTPEHPIPKREVGYWEDAPRGMKFGGGGRNSVSADVQKPNAAPTTTPPADGPWPKCLLSNCGTGVIVYADDGDDGTFCGTRGERWKFSKRYTAALTEIQPPMLKKREPLLIADAIRRLEQNGHADVAAELRAKATIPPADDEFEPVGTMPAVGDECVKVSHIQIGVGEHIELDVGSRITITGPKRDSPFGEVFDHDRNISGIYAECFKRGSWRILKRPTKPRDDVATGARVWKSSSGIVRTEIGGNHFLCATTWGVSPYAPDACHLKVNEYTELHGPERDAIVAECRKAMGL